MILVLIMMVFHLYFTYIRHSQVLDEKKQHSVKSCKVNIYFSNDIFSCNVNSLSALKCICLNNQKCKIRPEIC